uniref:CSON015207 protein n=1 Tax=Culicoides sonorensis TaxID=179676 RepID=A0A336MCZ8_CULSO
MRTNYDDVSESDDVPSFTAARPAINISESESDNSPLIASHEEDKEIDGKFPKARHVLGLMGFLGFANVYAMRVNLSVAIVAMVNNTNSEIPDFDNNTDLCPLPPYSNTTIPDGMGEGVTFPSMHAMLSRWIPPLERSRFAAYVYAGANFGTIVSLPLSGWLCSLDFMGGWPLAFYIFGGLGIVWIFWMLLVFDEPRKHPRISQEEKRYIEIACKIKDHDRENDDYVPWKGIFTSVPVWALLITQCGQSWAFYTVLTEIPTYMANILHFSIQQNAFLSALPYLTSWIFAILSSNFADWLLRKQYLSQLTSYKIWNAVASIVPAVGLLFVGYVGCDKILVMFMLAGLGAAYGGVYSGNQMNHMALSPRHAGTLYGITNAAANTCGFLAPYVIGGLIRGRENLTQWREVFYLAAVLDISGSLIYLLFASAEQQPWSTQRRSRLSVRN